MQKEHEKLLPEVGGFSEPKLPHNSDLLSTTGNMNFSPGLSNSGKASKARFQMKVIEDYMDSIELTSPSL